jgi:hypothetical protein
MFAFAAVGVHEEYLVLQNNNVLLGTKARFRLNLCRLQPKTCKTSNSSLFYNNSILLCVQYRK